MSRRAAKQPPLVKAVSEGSIKRVKQLIAAGASVDAAVDEYGSTLLHLAVDRLDTKNAPCRRPQFSRHYCQQEQQ